MTTLKNVVLADNAYGTIASGLAVGDTALSFTSGHGARFPVVASPNVMYCCLLNSSNVLEEIKITAHSSGSDSATIVRGAGGTTAKAWSAGDRIEARLSSTVLNGIFTNIFNVTDPAWGAVGDNSTDDKAAIQAAITALATLVSGAGLSTTYRPILYFPPCVGYKISGQITVPQNVNIIMEAPIFYAGAGGEAAMIIGVDSATNFTRSGQYVLDIRRTSQADWLSETDIGVKFIGVDSSMIWLKRIQGFTLGVQFQATANFGCFFNNVTVGELRENKVHIDITTSNAAFACNSNDFHGGEYACTSASPTGISRYGVRLGGSTGHNTNNWYAPSFELNLSQAQTGNPSAEAITCQINSACSDIHGHKVRTEGNSDTLLSITADAVKCTWESTGSARTAAYPSISYAGISDTSKYQTNLVLSHLDRLMQRSYLIFDSGVLGRKTNVYDGSTTYTVDGFDITISTFAPAIAQTNIAPSNDDVVTFAAQNRNLARFLDTRVNKRFVVFFDTGGTTNNVDFAVKPFDGGMATLSDNPATAHVYGEDANVFSWSGSAHAGSYVSSGANTYAFIYFTVDSLTKFAAFIYASGVSTKLRSMKIYALDQPCATFQLAKEVEFAGMMVASAIPTVDTWTRGDRIYNHLPSAAGTEGWVCVTSGTFGTLNSGSTTGGITISTTALVVNSTTGLLVGNYITIAGVTGVKRVIGITGLAVEIDTVASATVIAAAVAFQAPSLKTFGTIAA